jgi:Transposase DDE domain
VLRTSVAASDLDSGAVVSSYKALAQVERAFRAFNTDLDIRPIRHRTQDRVRAHVFLRMLSYYLSWHMQARLASLLFTDDDKPVAQSARTSPVAPAARSPRALAKAATKQTPGSPGAQLRHPARRPGHDLPEHHRPGRPRPARLPARHHPYRSPAASIRAAQRQPPPRGRVVSTPAPPPRKPR